MPGEVSIAPSETTQRSLETAKPKSVKVEKSVGKREEKLASKIPPNIGEADPKKVDPDAILKTLVMDETQMQARQPFLQQEGESEEQWMARLDGQAKQKSADTQNARTSQLTKDQTENGNKGQVSSSTEKTPEEEQKEISDAEVLESAERDYIDMSSNREELTSRYGHESTNSTYVGKQIAEHAAQAGLDHEQNAEFTGKPINQETRVIIQERAQVHIDRLLSSEQGRINPEKHDLVTKQTQRYLELVQQAQVEGDMSQDMDAQAVLQLIEENVWKLAYQDRVASENMLGDHGIRHLVGHNINVSEALSDELARNGQEVRAVDRLMMHQVMIDHDLGYAMDTVRQPIAEGKFGADAGHNVLAAKVLRERMIDSTDVMNKVFTQEQMSTMHEGILHHDAKPSRFKIGDTSSEARKNNIYSAIHTADNTHAFENKLPELLYGFPSSLRTLRLMQSAGEIGDSGMVDSLKGQLVADIQANELLTRDDKSALINAAKSLSAKSYEKSVPRIAGNDPELSLDPSGATPVTVRDSEIHRQPARHFGQEDVNAQVRKFVGDVAGVDENVSFEDQTEVAASDGSVIIRLRDAKPEGAKSDYQVRVEHAISDLHFQEFIVGKAGEVGDGTLALDQKQAESLLKVQSEGTEMHKIISTKLQSIIEQRRVRLQSFMQRV